MRLLSDPIPRLLFLRRIGRNWNMATDRPAHPSPYPWPHWGLQLERDPPARISCLRAGKNWPFADESSGCPVAVGKPTLHSKQTAQNHLAYFFSCLGDGEIVRESRDSEGKLKKKKNNPSLWTCLATKALEKCLPRLSTWCSRNYHPPSGYAWLKSLILLPESCSLPERHARGRTVSGIQLGRG